MLAETCLCIGQSIVKGMRRTVPGCLVRGEGHAVHQALEESVVGHEDARSALREVHPGYDVVGWLDLG